MKTAQVRHRYKTGQDYMNTAQVRHRWATGQDYMKTGQVCHRYINTAQFSPYKEKQYYDFMKTVELSPDDKITMITR